MLAPRSSVGRCTEKMNGKQGVSPSATAVHADGERQRYGMPERGTFSSFCSFCLPRLGINPPRCANTIALPQVHMSRYTAVSGLHRAGVHCSGADARVGPAPAHCSHTCPFASVQCILLHSGPQPCALREATQSEVTLLTPQNQSVSQVGAPLMDEVGFVNAGALYWTPWQSAVCFQRG